MNPHRLGWGLVASMPLAAMAFGAMVVGCILAREPKRLPVNGVTVSLVLLLGLATITSFTALGPPAEVWAKWETVLKIILGLLLTAALLTDRRRIDALLWLMVIALAYYGVKGGVFTVLSGGRNIVMGPDDTIIGDRNHLAVALLVSLPLMNYLRMHAAHHAVRLVLLAGMAATLFSVVGSQSRGALVALVATSLVLWLRSSRKILSGIVIAVSVAGATAFMPAAWTERMRSIESFREEGSAMGRVNIWMAGWAIAVDRPLVGGGFRAVYHQDIVDRYKPGVRARADHSIWFEALSEHGFPGLLAWLSVVVAGLVYAQRAASLARDRPDLRWAYDLARMSQVSVVAYLAGGTFLSIAYWDYFWTLMVIVAAAHALVVAAVRQDRAPASVLPAVAPSRPALAWRSP
jgi:probable O-glycosylation ligase (exosortase A-associated)